MGTATSSSSPKSQSVSSAAPADASLAGSGKVSSDQLQLVTFGIGQEEFGVDILSVQEINRMMALTRVPQSPPEVEGVINLRGRIIPVLDMRRRFGMTAGERSESSRIVVVEVHKHVIGFIVDRVHEVLRIERSIVEPAPPMVCSVDSEFIAGVGKLSDRLLILLDLERLFDAESVRASGASESVESAHAEAA